MAPPMACITWQRPGEEPHILHAKDAKPEVERWLSTDVTTVGHNVAYDYGCAMARWPDLIPAIFDKYGRNQVNDTMIRQQLTDIKHGVYRGFADKDGVWNVYKYNLGALSRRLCNRELDKDTWRLRYGEFLDVPLSEWPMGARVYPLEDARATLSCYEAQQPVVDEFRQTRYSLALHLSSVWGVKTDLAGVDRLEKEAQQARLELYHTLRGARLVKGSGVANQRAVRQRMVEVCREIGTPVRLTKKLKIAIDADSCESTDDELLKAFAEYQTLGAVIAKDVPMLRAGVYYPVHTRYSLADTTRARSAGPNIQNIRVLPGIRECFVPRPGKVFIQADFEGLELHTLAKTCLDLFGYSKLAEALRAGQDPHLIVAAKILGMPYDELVRIYDKNNKTLYNARQTGKVANFGIPGGLGVAKLVLFAKKLYGVTLTEREAWKLKEGFFESFPEMRRYFEYVNTLKQSDDTYTVVTPVSGMVRGGAKFTAACNHHFQALGAVVAKLAVWMFTRETYSVPSSPLFGARMVAFVHDEILAEVDREKSWAAAVRLEQIMIAAAKFCIPELDMHAPPARMALWSKKAVDLGPDAIWGE